MHIYVCVNHYIMCHSLQWRHNGRDSVSNHEFHDCLLNRLFRRRSKKTSKLRVTGLCAGNSPGTGEFPAQMASNAENVSIWWRHHGWKEDVGNWIDAIWCHEVWVTLVSGMDCRLFGTKTWHKETVSDSQLDHKKTKYRGIWIKVLWFSCKKMKTLAICFNVSNSLWPSEVTQATKDHRQHTAKGTKPLSPTNASFSSIRLKRRKLMLLLSMEENIMIFMKYMNICIFSQWSTSQLPTKAMHVYHGV